MENVLGCDEMHSPFQQTSPLELRGFHVQKPDVCAADFLFFLAIPSDPNTKVSQKLNKNILTIVWQNVVTF